MKNSNLWQQMYSQKPLKLLVLEKLTWGNANHQKQSTNEQYVLISRRIPKLFRGNY